MKQKNRKSVYKRVKISSKGKIMLKKNNRNHLLQQKSKRQKGLGKNAFAIHKTDEKRVTRSLPQL